MNTANFKEIPIKDELKVMLKRTASYFVPGLLLNGGAAAPAEPA